MPGGTAVFLQNRDFFGAMVVHVPLFHALRQRAGGRPLVVYSPFARGAVFRSLGLADETCLWAQSEDVAGAQATLLRRGLPALFAELRARRYDTIVSLRPKSSDVTAAVATSGARERLGFRTLLGRLALTRAVARDTSIYRPLNYLNLLGIEDREAVLRDSMRALAERAGAAPAPFARAFVLMPCGSEAPKLWGERNFVELGRRLVERDPGARLLLVLGPGERRYVELFQQAGLAERTSALIDASLPHIAQAVLGARVVIANDCGPSHVAQQAGGALVSLFGNWDGRAGVRIAEWFHPRPGARCLTTASTAALATLDVSAVLAQVDQVLAQPGAPGAVVRVRAGAAVAG